MNSTKLRQATIKHIENEIRAIKETEQEIDYMFESSHDREFIFKNRNIMPLVFLNRRVRKMQDIVTVIRETFDECPKDQQKVIELRYWSRKNLTWDGIAMELSMHRNTAHNYKNDFIDLVAKKLGWM
ncbi:hypothetical protein [Shouchella patagoniensis]|uniref:hypothetical protein n=1 Tax=Shouchella patagoniensis TaxID=228576 RepID=UPI000994F906|nr:hypothetical protein [Shouchella patagoniensis]